MLPFPTAWQHLTWSRCLLKVSAGFLNTPNYRPIWVMEVDQAIVGLSFQSFYYERSAYQATAEISIYVAPAYRRRGVGRQLLSRAIRQLSLGIKTLLGFIFAKQAQLAVAQDISTLGVFAQSGRTWRYRARPSHFGLRITEKKLAIMQSKRVISLWLPSVEALTAHSASAITTRFKSGASVWLLAAAIVNERLTSQLLSAVITCSFTPASASANSWINGSIACNSPRAQGKTTLV